MLHVVVVLNAFVKLIILLSSLNISVILCTSKTWRIHLHGFGGHRERSFGVSCKHDSMT